VIGKGVTTTIQIALIAGVLGGGALLVRDYTRSKAELRARRAADVQNAEIIAQLGAGLRQAQERAETFRSLNEELANVEDPETCRSLAVDRAFDLLRQHRAQD